MSNKRLTIEIEKDIDILKVLASDARVEILKLLQKGPKNVNEISTTLGVPQPTITVNIKMLEETGLIYTELKKGTKGLQKICHSIYSDILVRLITKKEAHDKSTLFDKIEMPIGVYKSVFVKPTCGLTSEKKIIGQMDDVHAFYLPEHIYAQHLWFAEGYLTYEFPNNLPKNMIAKRIEISMELCSEAPLYNENYPSDIYIWINSIEIGNWTSPGDFGTKRGLLNPDWWPDENTQHGVLKVFSVDRSGSYVDGEKISNVTIADLSIEQEPSINLKIGNKEGTENIGGVSLFGKKFGNYEQDIIMKLSYFKK